MITKKDRTQIAIDFARNILGYRCDKLGRITGDSMPAHANIFLINHGFLMEKAVSYCNKNKLLLMVSYCPIRRKFSACLSRLGKSYKKFTDEEEVVVIMQAIMDADKYKV